MRAKRIAAIVMSVFMVLSLFPSAVFAAAVSTLEGQVKINGNATPGTTLSVSERSEAGRNIRGQRQLCMVQKGGI